MTLFLTVLGAISLVVIVVWACGALYFDVGRGTLWGWIAVAGWLVLVAFVILTVKPFSFAWELIAVAFAMLLAWWFTQKPSNDRNWAPNFSQLCRIAVDGDHIAVRHVRNTTYRSATDYDVQYETRHYRLSALRAADVLILFWGSSWMSHPMVIFDFGNGQHLCFSVEARYREGQTYSLWKGLYRQYERMYVVSDERDAIGLRARFGKNQECYLYRLQLDSVAVRVLFQEYVDGVNELASSPRWYHGLTGNCTTSVWWQRTEKVALDVRLFLNGSLDKLLYDRGRLDSRLPFAELKAQSLINDRVKRASPEQFSEEIRRGLPGFEP